MYRIISLLLLAFAAPLPAYAVPFAQDLPVGVHYQRITVAADGSVTAERMPLVTPGGGPAPNPQPDPQPAPTAFVEEVRKQTAAVIAAGGSRTTGAGLSAVYNLASAGVADGSIPLDKAFVAVKAGSDSVMAMQADRDKWTAWRANIGAALTKLQTQGLLTTKEQIVGVLKEISLGIDNATGNNFSPKQLAKFTGSELAHIDATDGKADGLFDGINLLELLKLIIELIKLFSGGF